MPASSLFADRADPLAAQAAASLSAGAGRWRSLALAALAVQLAGDRELSLFYVGAVIGAFVVLRLVAIAIMALARRVGTIRGTTLRLAVRNIHRPGALTPSVVLSLGLGLTLLVSLALIDTNLRGQLSGTDHRARRRTSTSSTCRTRSATPSCELLREDGAGRRRWRPCRCCAAASSR